MIVDDIFARSSRDPIWRVRRRLIRHGLGLPGQGRRGPGRRGRLTARARRRLTAIDRELATETPRLESMFAMFNQLAAEPVGAERLPARAWPRPRLAQVAFVAALAAIVALCVVLSTQVHSVVRTCLTSASSASSAPSAAPSATSSAASSAVGRASGPSAFSPVRDLNCQAYATTNK
jgi:hypothetical protein